MKYEENYFEEEKITERKKVSLKTYNFLKNKKVGSLVAFENFFPLKKGTNLIVFNEHKKEEINFIVTGCYQNLVCEKFSIELKKLERKNDI